MIDDSTKCGATAAQAPTVQTVGCRAALRGVVDQNKKRFPVDRKEESFSVDQKKELCSDILRMFSGCLKDVLMILKGCFKDILVFWHLVFGYFGIWYVGIGVLAKNILKTSLKYP